MTNFGKKKTNFDSKASLMMYKELSLGIEKTNKPVKSDRNDKKNEGLKNGTLAAKSITSLQKEARSTNQASNQTNQTNQTNVTN